LSKGILPWGVVRSNVPSYGANVRDVNVSKSDVSKNVEQKVSEVTQDDVQLKMGIEQMTKFMKTSGIFERFDAIIV